MSLQHAYAVENMMPHAAFGDKESPYFRWYGKRPDVHLLHCFGCDVRVNVPLDSGRARKWVDERAYVGIYVGFKRNSSAHIVWKPGTAGEPGSLDYPGERMCKFFERFDEHLYLRTSDNPDFREFAGLQPTTADDALGTVPPDGKEYRVCKWFPLQKDYFYGTAVKNNTPGDFAYDVSYDDGDVENMTAAVFGKAVALFEEKSRTDPRAQADDGKEFDVLARNLSRTGSIAERV